MSLTNNFANSFAFKVGLTQGKAYKFVADGEREGHHGRYMHLYCDELLCIA